MCIVHVLEAGLGVVATGPQLFEGCRGDHHLRAVVADAVVADGRLDPGTGPEVAFEAPPVAVSPTRLGRASQVPREEFSRIGPWSVAHVGCRD